MRPRLTNLFWIALFAVSLSGCALAQPSPTSVALPAGPLASPTFAQTAEPAPSTIPPTRSPTARLTEVPTSPPPPAPPVATPTNTPTFTSLPPSPTASPTPTPPAFHTWIQLAFTSQAVHTLALHPTQEQIIYAGLGQDLQRSTDGGHSWQSLAQELPKPPCVEGEAWQVTVNPTRPEEFYAYFPGQSPWLFQDCPAVLARSEDGGRHWTPLALPKLPWPWGARSGGGPSEMAPQALSIYPHPRTSELYVWEYLDTDPRSGGAEALLKSLDKGRSWQVLPMPPNYGTTPNHRFFGFYGSGDKAVLYGMTQDVHYLDSGTNPVYLYRSVDGTAPWEQISLPDSPRAYAPLPGTAGLYAAVASFTNWWNGALELYRVTDLEGEKIGQLPRLGHVFPDGILRVDPGNGNVLVWTDRLQESLHEPPIEAIHLSEDGGRTWVPLALPHPLTVNDLAVQRSISGGYALIYLASDDGLWVYAYQRSPLSDSAQATAVVARATATETAAQATVAAHAGSPPPGRFAPDPVFEPAWRDYSLDMYSSVAHAFSGWALEPAQEIELAIQGFGYAEGSLSEVASCDVRSVFLMWRSDTRQVYFLPDEIYGQDWEFVTRPCLPLYRVYLDTWEPGQPNNEDISPPYPAAVVPRFGIGKVWREHFYGDQGQKEGLGLYFATGPEEHTRGKVQPFEQATMLYREDTGEIYVLFPEFAHQPVGGEGLTTDPLWFKVEVR